MTEFETALMVDDVKVVFGIFKKIILSDELAQFRVQFSIDEMLIHFVYGSKPSTVLR